MTRKMTDVAGIMVVLTVRATEMQKREDRGEKKAVNYLLGSRRKTTSWPASKLW